MTLDETLTAVEGLGFTVQVEGGNPRLVGTATAVPLPVLDALRQHRQAIIDRFAVRRPRRVVLLNEDGTIERVLEECSHEQHHQRVLFHAAANLGRTVAGEWHRLHDGKWAWTRFLSVRRDSGGVDGKPAGDTDGRLG